MLLRIEDLEQAPNVTIKPMGHADPAGDFIYKNAALELLAALMSKKPMWKYEVRLNISSASTEIHSIAIASRDDEELGTIACNHKYDVVFDIHNARIADKMVRKTYIETTKVDRVLREVNKHFYPETPQELTDKWRNASLKRCLNKTAYKVCSYDTRAMFDKFMQSLRVEVASNLAHYITKSDSDAFTVEEVRRVWGAMGLRLSVEEMEDKCQSYGYAVQLNGGVYNIQRISDNTSWRTTNLPEYLKAPVGMLKMVDKETFIEGVGYKYDEDKFYVAQENNDE